MRPIVSGKISATVRKRLAKVRELARAVDMPEGVELRAYWSRSPSPKFKFSGIVFLLDSRRKGTWTWRCSERPYRGPAAVECSRAWLDGFTGLLAPATVPPPLDRPPYREAIAAAFSEGREFRDSAGPEFGFPFPFAV